MGYAFVAGIFIPASMARLAGLPRVELEPRRIQVGECREKRLVILQNFVHRRRKGRKAARE